MVSNKVLRLFFRNYAKEKKCGKLRVKNFNRFDQHFASFSLEDFRGMISEFERNFCNCAPLKSLFISVTSLPFFRKYVCEI
ncbi:MAG: hypothetical protein C5B52_01180 [Bacteroidetes bacterium]|nr:MAG: hypothetical protein C5B52_01180 [Bacteroidota bacterium]